MSADGRSIDRKAAIKATYELKVWLGAHIAEDADAESLCLAMLNVAIQTLAQRVPGEALAGTLRQYADNVEHGVAHAYGSA